MLAIVFLLLVVTAATGLSAWLWSSDPEGAPALESVASVVLVTGYVATALCWALASLHLVNRPALLSGAALLATASVGHLVRDRRRDGTSMRLVRRIAHLQVPVGIGPLLAIVTPVVLWLAFACWRATLTAALNHDALSYHLGRAMDIVRTGTWRYLPVEDFRLAWFPCNYEIFLADVLLLSGDSALGFVAPATFVAALLVCAAYGERLWGRTEYAWLGVTLWVSAPVVLFHGSDPKNDLMAMICVVGVALWGARWVARGGTAPLVLAGLAFVLGVGTKPPFVVVAPAALLAFLPFGLLTRIRQARLPAWKLVAGAGVAGLLALLGGTVPLVAHALHLHDGLPAEEQWRLNMLPSYGALGNLWKFPLLVALRGVTSNPETIPVLGTGDRWFWPRFEPFYSDFGAAWSVLLPVFPVGALVLWRQRRGAPPERLAATLFLCAVAALTLPTRYRVDGTLNSFPRYLMFLPLVMADVALVPLVVLASERFRGAVTRALIVVFGALSIWNQTRVGGQDLFAPVAYLKHIIRTPDFRDPAFEGRASVAVDYFVGPRDRVAIDGDFGAWIYPAYGRGLTRQVEVLPYDDAARLEGARRADWVAIDRYWSICWGAPDFQDMMHIRIRKGAPTPRDVTVLAALDRDPQFKLVWSEPSMGQFLYKRRGQARL